MSLEYAIVFGHFHSATQEAALSKHFFKNLKEFDLFSKNNFQQPTGHGVFLEQFGRPWIRGSVLSFVPQKTLFITSASALMSLSSLSLVPVHLSLELFTSLHFSTVACPTPEPTTHLFIHPLSLSLFFLLWPSLLTTFHLSPLETIIFSLQSSQRSLGS